MLKLVKIILFFVFSEILFFKATLISMIMIITFHCDFKVLRDVIVLFTVNLVGVVLIIVLISHF